MPLTLVKEDITKMKVDVIVNAANTKLQMGGGVCGAIFRAAGETRLQEACNKLSPIATGEAVITRGFKLPASYIIHTVGPIYRGGHQGERNLLYSSYWNSLKVARENKCTSIAFPLISSGIYGYPPQEALEVAKSAIIDFLKEEDLDVYLSLFNKNALKIPKEIREVVDKYKRKNFDEQVDFPRTNDSNIGNLSKLLSHYIYSKNLEEEEISWKANLGKGRYEKIKTASQYSPSKPSLLALALALELSPEETRNLLESAGYTLTNTSLFDLIIGYSLERKVYDLYKINELLFFYDLPQLGP